MNAMITSAKLPRLITTAIFGALASSWGAASIAADPVDAPQAVVKYGDLNLSNPQGAAALYRRIVGASHQVCPSFDNRDLASQAASAACIHKAIADAVTKVGRPELFAIYNAQNHQPLQIVVAAAESR